MIARLAAASASLLALAAVVAPAAPVSAGQGSGNPVLTVSASTLVTDRVSEITVTGTDYLVPPHAPGVQVRGGVYVFFGWVADATRFGPSIRNSTNNDGTFGVSYAYPGDGGDPSTRDDGTGTMRLVSFTAGGESGQATDFHMDDNGNWSTTLRIYGSTFTTSNPVTGESRSYDCTQVQCGIFTIGAHGTASATNEHFIPLTFSGAPAASIPVPTTAPPAGQDVAPPASTATTTAAVADASSTTVAPAPGVATDGDDAAAASSPEGPDGDGAVSVAVASTSSTGSPFPLIALVAGVVVAAALATTFVRRRDRRAPAHP